MNNMKFKSLHIPFYFGIVVLVIGTLFRLMHWEGSSLIIGCGLVLEALFAVLVTIEMFTSTKAATKTKAIGLLIIVIPFSLILIFLRGLPIIIFLGVFGSAYLSIARKRFLINKRDLTGVTFDSI